MRNTITAFAWLNTVLYFASAVLALFVSDRDPPKFHDYVSPGSYPLRRQSMLSAFGGPSGSNSPFPTAAQSPDCKREGSPSLSSRSMGASTDSIGGSTGDDVTPPDLVRESLGRARPAVGPPSRPTEPLRDEQDRVTPALRNIPTDSTRVGLSSAPNHRRESSGGRKPPFAPSAARQRNAAGAVIAAHVGSSASGLTASESAQPAVTLGASIVGDARRRENNMASKLMRSRSGPFQERHSAPPSLDEHEREIDLLRQLSRSRKSVRRVREPETGPQ
jgi:hypothetical protein